MSSSELPPAPPAGDQGPSATARVELASRIASLELSLVGADFRPLASGMGSLSATVPPGIYQVVARAGPIVERTLINLAPGAIHRNDSIAVSFPAAAPVQNTSTTHEYHQYAVEQASQEVSAATGPPSGLVIVVRDVRGLEGPPLEAADLHGFALLDQSLQPLPGFEQGWKIRQAEAIATWSGRLLGGGYALRTDPSRITGGTRRPTSSQAYDQALWLSPNWQTVVFIVTGPGGPQTSVASVHMSGLGMGWSPYEVDVGLALELAAWGLKEGRSVVPDDLLGVLLNTKFINPMLGVVGAHSLLLRQELNRNLLEVVLNNLEGMLPGHPDMLALRVMAANRDAAERASGEPAPPPPPARSPSGTTWPPMLLPAYRALIALDAVDPGVVVDGSPAELAAANLLVQGMWTSWMPLPPIAPVPPGAPPRPAFDARQPTAVGVLPVLGRDPSLIETLQLEDPATARVASYLGALASLEGPDRRVERFATLSPQEIGLATTLPAATVDRTLARIGASLPPEPPPGGDVPPAPRGLLSTLLPFVAATALLLAGAAGAAALCAGNADCRELFAGSGPSDTPTPIDTPEPPTEPPPPTAAEPTPLVVDFTSPIDFGEVTIGGTPGEEPLTVVTSAPATIVFVLADDPEGAFASEQACAAQETEPGLFECTIVVTFHPRREGDHRGSLELFDPGTQEPLTVDLVGVGVPLFLRHPLRVDLGPAFIGGEPATESLTVHAFEQVPLQFGIVDGASDAFAPEPSCQWQDAGQGLFECTIMVFFSPQEFGEQFATLGIFTAEPEPRLVELVGTGDFQIE